MWDFTLAKMIVGVLLLAACGCGSEHQLDPPSEQPPPRNIVPPAGKLRAIPPYAVSQKGIGPFRLGMNIRMATEELVDPPSVQSIDVAKLVDATLFFAERNQLLVGSDSASQVTFVAALSSGLAKYRDDLNVGDRLPKDVARLEGLRDPRIICIRDESVCVVMRAARIGAFLVRSGLPRLGESVLTPTTTTVKKGVITTRGGDGKVLATRRVNGALAAILIASEGKQYVFTIVKKRTTESIRHSVVVLRLHGKKLVRQEEFQAYQVSNSELRWIGRSVDNTDVMMEVGFSGGKLEVKGLLVSKLETSDALIAPLVVKWFSMAHRPKGKSKGAGTLPSSP